MEILISFQGAWSARGGSPQTNGKQRGMLEGRGRWSKRNLDGHKYRCQDVYRQLERGQIFPPPAGFPYATLLLHRIGCVHHFQVSLTGGPFTNKRPAIVPSEDCFLNLVVDSFTKGWGGRVDTSFIRGKVSRADLSSIYKEILVLLRYTDFILDFRFRSFLSFSFLYFFFYSNLPAFDQSNRSERLLPDRQGTRITGNLFESTRPIRDPIVSVTIRQPFRF